MQPNLDYTLLALADPTRRAILRRLSSGEARVTEIAQPFAMSLNAVSKHILVLERAHLVRRRRAGREHFLSFNPKPLDEAAKRWTRSALWTARLDQLERVLRAPIACQRSEAMNEYGVAIEAGTLRLERLLPGPIERVWEYLTESTSARSGSPAAKWSCAPVARANWSFSTLCSRMKSSRPSRTANMKGITSRLGSSAASRRAC